MAIKNINLRIIGGSYHLIVPMEFIKVYELDKNLYDFSVKNGKDIIYTKVGEIEPSIKEESIIQE